MEQYRLEVKDALLRSAQKEYTNTTPIGDCRTMIQVGDTYRQCKERIMKLLNSLEHMWDGHLGQIRSARHQIKLLPGSRTSYLHLRRAGLK